MTSNSPKPATLKDAVDLRALYDERVKPEWQYAHRPLKDFVFYLDFNSEHHERIEGSDRRMVVPGERTHTGEPCTITWHSSMKDLPFKEHAKKQALGR